MTMGSCNYDRGLTTSLLFHLRLPRPAGRDMGGNMKSFLYFRVTNTLFLLKYAINPGTIHISLVPYDHGKLQTR